MALPKNDDFSNRELSIEELDAIAAGSIFGDIWHYTIGGLYDAEKSFFRSHPTVAAFLGGGLLNMRSYKIS